MQVLCASNAAHDAVDPINPPKGVPVGERVAFEGFANEPDAQLNPKKNIFGKLAPDLLTNAGRLLSNQRFRAAWICCLRSHVCLLSALASAHVSWHCLADAPTKINSADIFQCVFRSLM